MKLIWRETMVVAPGKWNEAIGLQKKRTELATQKGSPPFKFYRSISGQGDWSNTIILEREFDSFAAWETFFDGATKNPQIKSEFIDKWQNITQSHKMEFYTPFEL